MHFNLASDSHRLYHIICAQKLFKKSIFVCKNGFLHLPRYWLKIRSSCEIIFTQNVKHYNLAEDNVVLTVINLSEIQKITIFSSWKKRTQVTLILKHWTFRLFCCGTTFMKKINVNERLGIKVNLEKKYYKVQHKKKFKCKT